MAPPRGPPRRATKAAPDIAAPVPGVPPPGRTRPRCEAGKPRGGVLSGGVDSPLLERALHAAFRPLHAFPAVAGGVAAVGLVAAGLLPVAVAVGGLSAVTWCALVTWEILHRPAGASPPAASAGGPAPLPAGLPARPALAAVEAAAARVQSRLHAHDGVLAGALAELAAEAEAVAAREAAARADAAGALLATADLPARAAAVEAAQRRAAAAPAATQDTLRAAAARQSIALDTWRGLGPLADAIDAELALAAATLDELDARAARLALEDPAAGPAAGQALRDGLHSLTTRLSGVERAAAQTLKELP